MRLINFQYAKAFMQAIDDKKKLDLIYNEAKDVILPTFEIPELKNVLKHPGIARDRQILILERVLKGAISDYWFNFFLLVINKGRASMLIQILESFLLQYEQSKGIKKAKIITAYSLKDGSIEMLKNIAMKFVECKQLIVTNIIDPSIIGGYIIFVDGKQLDCSLKNHLRQVQERLIE
jgi:F-type H+-transporting ATPase subunit delta